MVYLLAEYCPMLQQLLRHFADGVPNRIVCDQLLGNRRASVKVIPNFISITADEQDGGCESSLVVRRGFIRVNVNCESASELFKVMVGDAKGDIVLWCNFASVSCLSQFEPSVWLSFRVAIQAANLNRAHY